MLISRLGLPVCVAGRDGSVLESGRGIAGHLHLHMVLLHVHEMEGRGSEGLDSSV